NPNVLVNVDSKEACSLEYRVGAVTINEHKVFASNCHSPNNIWHSSIEPRRVARRLTCSLILWKKDLMQNSA
ncbi:MAG: hypothetical protein JSV87_03360, partial [Candidatus Bathyarchaeota archaeon]